jgi:hypothetical protein
MKKVLFLLLFSSSLFAQQAPTGPVMSYRLLNGNDAWVYGTVPMYAYPQNGGVPIIGPSNISDTGVGILYKGQPISVTAGVQNINGVQGPIQFIQGAQIAITPGPTGTFTIGFAGNGSFPLLTTYSTAVNYAASAIVFYNGSVYTSLGNSNLGNLPTNPTYWALGVPTQGVTLPATILLYKGTGTQGVTTPATPGVDYTIPSGNIATASALFTSPAQCSFGYAPTGITAAGNATGCAVIGAGASIPATTLLLKGNNSSGNAIAATPGVDYLLPNGSAAALTYVERCKPSVLRLGNWYELPAEFRIRLTYSLYLSR